MTLVLANGAAHGGYFLSGLVVAFANPTALFFFAALLPQFIDPSRERFLQSAVLSAAFITVCILVQAGLAVAANQAAQWILRDNGRLMNEIAAVVLVLGGLLLVLARG
jgi:threonine/homoserine/homoserine lactone efflux protein